MVSSNFDDRELDEVSLKIAKQDIGETPDSRSKGLQILKDKLLSIDDLLQRPDDEFLLRYLRVAKFDANKASERVRKYYTARKKYSHVFDKFYLSASSTALNAHHFLASPRRAEDNSAVIIHRRGLFDPSTMNYEEMFLLDTLIMDYLVQNPVTQMCGATIIIDFDKYSYQNFLQDTPRRVKMAVDVFQNSFPLRFKTIHVLNAPRIFSLLYNMLYPFLTKKLRSRLHFHYNNDGWKSLHDLIPADILPEAYGGTILDAEMIDLSQKVIKKEKYFRE